MNKKQFVELGATSPGIGGGMSELGGGGGTGMAPDAEGGGGGTPEVGGPARCQLPGAGGGVGILGGATITLPGTGGGGGTVLGIYPGKLGKGVFIKVGVKGDDSDGGGIGIPAPIGGKGTAVYLSFLP